ncbi:hypothetical protein HQ590_06390 [bacterium]|nr:hypothetical protein [bacterium]
MSDKNQGLLLVTNLTKSPQSGAVELNLKELRLPKTAKIKPVTVPGSFADGRVDGPAARVDKLPPLTFAAFRISK